MSQTRKSRRQEWNAGADTGARALAGRGSIAATRAIGTAEARFGCSVGSTYLLVHLAVHLLQLPGERLQVDAGGLQARMCTGRQGGP